jgi:type IV pilus biogenesis protein CpaD/CtpE
MDTRLCSFSRRALMLALAASLAACAQTTPRWDSTFGNSVRSTFAAQIADPAAATNTNPVSGMDGRAARTAQEKYERGASETEPSAAPVSLMNGSVTR